MKLKTKCIVTAVTMLVYMALLKLLTPVAQLAANSVIVAQLDHSDSSSLINSLVGDGSTWAINTISFIYGGILIFVWTRKTTETKDSE